MSREVPEGWQLEKLGSFVEEFKVLDSAGDLPPLSVTKSSGIVFQSDKFNKRIANTSSSKYKVIRRGEYSYDPMSLYYGAIGRLSVCDVGIVSPAYITFRLKGIIERCFFDLYIKTTEFLVEVNKVTTGGNQDGKRKKTDWNSFCSLPISLPPVHEQRRIAEILSSVDETIAATRAVIEQTRRVRSEILSTSFPDHRAFEWSTADDTFEGWSIEPASSICESIIDCKNRTPPVTENGYPVVRTPNVRNGRFRYDGLQFTDKQSFQEWTARGVPGAGDILFTREAPYGEVCIAPAMEFCLGQRMMFMRPDTSRVSSDFLLYALQSGPVKQEMFRRAGGSTVGHLRVGDVRELPIPVAPKEAQLRLTSTLRSLDEALDSNEKTLSRLGDCKSALMSDLLTGRKRVTDYLPMAAE
ncbi:Type-1 restriction enzyme EcoKI specificity protein [compost metagenome]